MAVGRAWDIQAVPKAQEARVQAKRATARVPSIVDAAPTSSSRTT